MEKRKQPTPQEQIDSVGAIQIADAIKKIEVAMRVLNTSNLSRKAIVTLIHDQSRVSKKTIEIVLNNLAYLGRDWLKNAAQ